ncbi:MAG: hypothetical protein NXI18_18510 [Alphaproteobacteria bacterium]|nr:hypothetical protein [Alphaproteobacteria bacterium]
MDPTRTQRDLQILSLEGMHEAEGGLVADLGDQGVIRRQPFRNIEPRPAVDLGQPAGSLFADQVGKLGQEARQRR